MNLNDKIEKAVNGLLENKDGVYVTTKRKVPLLEDLRTTGVLRTLRGGHLFIVVKNTLEGIFVLKGIEKDLEEGFDLRLEEGHLKLHSKIRIDDFIIVKNKTKKESFFERVKSNILFLLRL